MNLGDRTLFSDLVAYTDVHDGGSFVLLDADGTTYDITTAPSGRITLIPIHTQMTVVLNCPAMF